MEQQKLTRQAERLIVAGDRIKARQVLNRILQKTPSADLWVLMAAAMDTDEERIKCLQYALQLDPWHSEANRQLSGVQPVNDLPMLVPDDEPSLAALTTHPEAEARSKWLTRRSRRRFGCMFLFILIGVVTSFIALSMVGIIPGGITIITQIRGGPGPVTEIENRPIADMPDAILQIDPVFNRSAYGEQVEVIDHGYTHEYTFEAEVGDEFEGYIQFMSVTAGDVSSNVVILDPNGQPVSEDVCFFRGEDGLLGGQGNANFNCITNIAGIWAVRILGLRGESVGTYFISVQKLSS